MCFSKTPEVSCIEGAVSCLQADGERQLEQLHMHALPPTPAHTCTLYVCRRGPKVEIPVWIPTEVPVLIQGQHSVLQEIQGRVCPVPSPIVLRSHAIPTRTTDGGSMPTFLGTRSPRIVFCLQKSRTLWTLTCLKKRRLSRSWRRCTRRLLRCISSPAPWLGSVVGTSFRPQRCSEDTRRHAHGV